jgi:ElaA protein
MKFQISTWEDLTRDQLYAVIRLRVDVFVVEQNCPYPDLDGKDQSSLHLFSIDPSSYGSSASSYLRLCKPGVSYDEPSIGRVATELSSRGSGLGKMLMEKGIEECEKRMLP